MRKLFQDYETFYGPVQIPGPPEYTKKGKLKPPKTLNLSLKNPKLSMTDYVRHPEFEVFGAALRWEDEPKATFYKAPELKHVYADIDWKNTKVVAHNAMFEGIVNYEHFSVVPGAYFCTMACAEALFQGSVSVGLGNLAEMFRLGSKLNELHNFKGLRAKDLSDAQWASLGAYCEQDINLTIPLYHALAPALPAEEHEIMNQTLMMWANPALKVDVAMAQEARDDAIKARDVLVAKTGFTFKQLGGSNSFAAALKGKLGYVPMKISKKTGKPAYAFAKTDKEFTKLKSHSDEAVRNLVLARQEVKTPIAITRSERLIKLGTTGTRMLPLAYHFARAHTMRWTGGNKMNPQALTRKSKMRRSIVAPPGHVILVIDSAQIECRTLGWIAGQEDLVLMFRNGEDPYNHMAMLVFGGGPYDKESDERFMGKTMVLGLGYGMGAVKFHNEIVTGARGKALPITLDFAYRAVQIYRGTNDKICGTGGMWEQATDMIEYLATGKEPREFLDGLVTLRPEDGKVVFPNGNFLRYAELTNDEGDYKYKTTKKGKTQWNKIYGGLFTENITQATARHIVAHQCNQVAQRYRWVMTSHDEGGFLVPEAEAEEAMAFAIREFRTNLSWTDIPLDAEGKYDVFYCK